MEETNANKPTYKARRPQGKKMNTKGKHQRQEHHVFADAMHAIDQALGAEFCADSIVEIDGDQFEADDICEYVAMLLNAGAELNEHLFALADAISAYARHSKAQGFTRVLDAVRPDEFRFIGVQIIDLIDETHGLFEDLQEE